MNEIAPLSLSLTPLAYEAAPLRSKIVNSLRQAIEIGQLKAGDRLVELDLCQQLSVSRTSLREALRELQAEKLVVRVPRGLIVAETSEREAINIYQVRAALEGLIAEQFAELASAADIAALKDTFERLEWAYQKGNFENILAEKRNFYDVICTGASNEVVRDMLNRLNSKINQLRSTSRADSDRGTASLAEFRVLAQALIERRPKSARMAAIRHVEAAARSASRHRHEQDGENAAGKPVIAKRQRWSGLFERHHGHRICVPAHF